MQMFVHFISNAFMEGSSIISNPDSEADLRAAPEGRMDAVFIILHY